MKFYAYIPDYFGNEPTGTDKCILFELKTIKGAKKRAYRVLQKMNNYKPCCIVLKTYTNIYDKKTYKTV